MNTLHERVENLIHECWKSFNHKAGSQLFSTNNKMAMLLHFSRIIQNSLDLVIYDKKEVIELEILSEHSVNNKSVVIDLTLQLHNGKESLTIPFMLNCYMEKFASTKELDFVQQVYHHLNTLESATTLPRTLSGFLLLMTDSRKLVRNSVVDNWDISEGIEIFGPHKFAIQHGDINDSFTLKRDYRFEWHQHGNLWFSLVQGV